MNHKSLLEWCMETGRFELLEEWNDKNNFSAKEISFGSNRKVWWKCSKGHEWQAVVYNRTNLSAKCPLCYSSKAIQGINDFATLYPLMLKEWNWERNEKKDPTKLSPNSKMKVWWKCEQGHEWQSTISNIVAGGKCPTCYPIKQKDAHSKENKTFEQWCIYTHSDNLLREWNSKNEKRPSDYSWCSGEKIWWKCVRGHEWQSTIAHRIYGTNCPYCSNKKVLSGYNDLATVVPQLAFEWHPEKNGETLPSAVTPHSTKKVWWQCAQGHEWQASVNSRYKGVGCPICKNKQLLKGVNDLQSEFPTLAKEWHPTKNGKLRPDDVIGGKNILVWWQCDMGHVWRASINNRKNGTGCPECNKHFKTSFPEQAIFFYVKKYFNSTINGDRHLLKELDIFLPEFNIAIEYDGVAWHQNIERDIEKDKLCEENHIFLIRVRELGCPLLPFNRNVKIISVSRFEANQYNELNNVIRQILFLINKQLTVNVDIEADKEQILASFSKDRVEKSIAITNPELLLEWHPTKNKELTPYMFTRGSELKVWWVCNQGHEWQQSIYNRCCGHGCDICAHQRTAQSKYKKVRNLDTGEIFESVSAACEKYKIASGNLRKVCVGERKTTGGFRWEYYTSD